MHTHFADNSWQDARERYKKSACLPSSLLVPSLSAIRDGINSTEGQSPSTQGPSLKELIAKSSIPASVLSPGHIDLLGQVEDGVDLVKKVKSGKWTVEEVVESHLRMAAIAQQALGCYSDIFFDKARARARELDRRIKSGQECGKLCGVPISIKAHIAMDGTGSDRGFIFDVLEPSAVKALVEKEEEEGTKGISKSTMNLIKKQGDHLQTTDAVHLNALLDQGAVIVAKTVMPQSVMQLDTRSNLHGQTLNPYNMHLSPGGSSGGESASVSSGASVLGIGTDIGGSVRQPAAVTGLYGIRCTVGRIGIGGTRSTMLGNEGILGTAGPLCRSKKDLDLVTEVLVSGTAGSDPFLTPPLPWRALAPTKTKARKLRVGVLLHDGVVLPITPIRRAMDSVVEKLSGAESIELVPCQPGNYHRRGWDLTRELYFMDGGQLIKTLAKMTDEPLLPLTEYILSSPVKDHTASECWELQYARESFKREYWREVWVKNDLDVLLCPAAHLCAPRCGQIRYWGYTSFFNLVDLPGVVFPVKAMANSKIDGLYEEQEQAGKTEPMSALDAETRQEYVSHRETFNGAPVGLQLIGKRFQEEELLDALDVVEGAMSA